MRKNKHRKNLTEQLEGLSLSTGFQKLQCNRRFKSKRVGFAVLERPFLFLLCSV